MKSEKGFVQTQIIVAIIVGLIVISGASCLGAREYKNRQTRREVNISKKDFPLSYKTSASMTLAPDNKTGISLAPEATSSQVPIIDIHAHIIPTSKTKNESYIDALVARAKIIGVKKILLGLHARHIKDRRPTYSTMHDEWVLEAYKKHGDIIAPMLAGFDPQDTKAPSYVRAKLSSGPWVGIGELDLRNMPKQTRTPMNSVILMEIYRIAGEFKKPVLVHHELGYGIDRSGGQQELEDAVRGNPNTIFIFAHSCPKYILNLMNQFNNLYCQLDKHLDIPSTNFLNRIMIGSDMQESLGSATEYENIIRQFRNKIKTLKNENAKNLAYKTAEKIFPITLPASKANPPKVTTPIYTQELPKAKTFKVLSVAKDAGSRVSSGSVPFIMKLDDGRFRLYYCQGGIVSAISSDGLNFERESGVRISSSSSNAFEKVVCDPTLVKLPDGKVRMYYKGANDARGGPGQSIHKIFSAFSSDGLIFQKEGLRIDSESSGDNGWASVPDAVLLPDGRIRLYFVSADPSIEGAIMTMTAGNGLNFAERKALNVKNVVDPALVILPDGTYLLLVAVINERLAPYWDKGLYLFTSNDGLSFENKTQLLKEQGVFDPTGILLNKDTLRIYYGYGIPTPTETRSITIKFNY